MTRYPNRKSEYTRFIIRSSIQLSQHSGKEEDHNRHNVTKANIYHVVFESFSISPSSNIHSKPKRSYDENRTRKKPELAWSRQLPPIQDQLRLR